VTDKPEPDILPFASKRAWETWLRKHHKTTDGVWLKFARKNSGIPTVTYDEALEVALCYGWIDGKVRSLDESFHLQWWTPRRKRSRWSHRNRARAVELIESGKMKPAGLAEVERAKADGRWEAAYDSPATATVPDDLANALKRNAKARKFFETLNSTNRYAILYRIQDAKKPETRARRIEKYVAMLAEEKTLY
jgi:uncharacterized protein YdeI (YjbR/CyaY-like superfamily)